MWRWILERTNAQIDVLITIALTWAVVHGGTMGWLAVMLIATTVTVVALLVYKKMLLQS
jgi:hypothetical protein